MFDITFTSGSMTESRISPTKTERTATSVGSRSPARLWSFSSVSVCNREAISERALSAAPARKPTDTIGHLCQRKCPLCSERRKNPLHSEWLPEQKQSSGKNRDHPRAGSRGQSLPPCPGRFSTLRTFRKQSGHRRYHTSGGGKAEISGRSSEAVCVLLWCGSDREDRQPEEGRESERQGHTAEVRFQGEERPAAAPLISTPSS